LAERAPSPPAVQKIGVPAAVQRPALSAAPLRTTPATRPAPAPVDSGTLGDRLWNWVLTYDEISRLKDAQLRLGAQYGPKGVLTRVFDPEFYLAQGPITGFKDPLKHYLLVGEKKGRSPVEGFDPVYYAKALGSRRPASGSLLRHFFTVGADMGVAPSADLAKMAEAAKEAQMSPLEHYFRWAEASRRKARAAGGAGSLSAGP
jgi:hypothetical protein